MMSLSSLKRLNKLAFALFTSACVTGAVPFSALAQGANLNAAGVQLNNGFKSAGAETTFLSGDPLFNDHNAYELTPSSRPQFPSVGVNLPALNSGNLKSVGKFESLFFYYQTASGAVADSGLRYYAQDNDGFIHTAASISFEDAFSGGITEYNVTVGAGLFSPTLNSKINNVNVRYAGSHAGTIYFLDPTVAGSACVSGLSFNFNTTNDTQFNNN